MKQEFLKGDRIKFSAEGISVLRSWEGEKVKTFTGTIMLIESYHVTVQWDGESESICYAKKFICKI